MTEVYDSHHGFILVVMYQSIPSLTIPFPPPPPQATPHSSCPWGRVFAPLSRPGVLNQSKSSIILKKSAIFALSLKQMGSSSFHMFIYASSEQCDLRRFPVMAEITRILTANIRRQFFFVITTTTSTNCLVQNFQLICYSQRKKMNVTIQQHW